MWQRIIDCLGLAVSVGTTDEDTATRIDAVLRSYATSTDPVAVTYVLEAEPVPTLLRDGALHSEYAHPLDLVAGFEIELYRRVLSLVEGIPLHAGAVVDPSGNAVIFAGRSGAGKSTLLRALLPLGYRYLSEECVLLLDRQRCRGLARALTIEDPHLAVPAGYHSDDYTLRGAAGSLRLFHPPERVMWRADARAACVISIEHAPDAVFELARLRGGAGLLALWPAIFRHEPRILDRVDAAFEGIPLFSLRTSRPHEALERVLLLAQELGLARP